MKENTNIDVTKLQELIEAYAESETPRERREIENEVLEATVWQRSESNQREGEFTGYSKEELELISEAVTDPSERVKRLLRRPYVDNL